MVQSRSFKEYVANSFYNELWNAVSDYLEQNHREPFSVFWTLFREHNLQLHIILSIYF